MQHTTESESRHKDLEKMDTAELMLRMNQEDQTVADAVKLAIPAISALVDAVADKMKNGGRLFYIGAGTSGRLGIVDASECPPTYGIEFDRVIGIIAGGDTAIRRAVEFAEDEMNQAWLDLTEWKIQPNDVVVGIAASGSTPYVIGGVTDAKKIGCITGCIVCNANSPLAAVVDFPVEVVTGPEFVTGSTRMKAGTGQKLALNMLSTGVMIRLGRVKGNQMVDMQLTNNKLVERGTLMLMKALNIERDLAVELLQKHGGVRKSIDAYQSS
jgi:N-acetylmuramic acid 6-phosphate etherase